MANEINLIVGSEAIKGLDALIEKLNLAHNSVLQLSQDSLNMSKNVASVKTPSGLNEVIAKNKLIVDSLNKVTESQKTYNNQIQKTLTITKQSSRENVIANQIVRQETDRNIKATTNLGGAYAKASAQLLILKKTAKDYAISLGETHPKTLQAINDANDLGGRIGSADKVVGDFQRNVGNYSNSITNGVGKAFGAIRQLAYILPGVGIAGILGFLIDPIVKYVSELDIFKAKINELAETKKKLDEITKEGTTNAIQEQLTLKGNLAIAKDTALSYKERMIAVKNLQDTYPFYFENLTKEQILAGQTANAEKLLTEALLSRAKANASVSKITENQGKIIDLEEERLTLVSDLSRVESQAASDSKRAASGNEAAAISNLQSSDRIANAKKRILNLDKEILAYNQINNRLTAYSISNQEKAIGLDYKKEKGTAKSIKDLKDLTFKNEDYLASQYALLKLKKELEASGYEQLYKDESQSFDQRIIAYRSFVDKKLELADDEIVEIKRLSNKSFEEDKEKEKQRYNEFVKNKEATNSQKVKALNKYNRYIETATLKHNYDLEAIELKYSNKVLDIQKDSFEKQQELRDEQYRITELGKINEQELNDVRQHQLNLLNVTKSITLKGLEAIEESRTEAARKNQIARLNLEIQGISDQLSHESSGTEAWIKLNELRISKTKERVTLETDVEAKAAEKVRKYLQDTNAYLETFGKSWDLVGLKSLDFFTKLDSEGKTAFENLVLNGDNATKSIGVAINATLEVFQDVMKLMDQASERNYQNEIKRLDNQKNISIGLAGESATAKAEVERQYEIKRRQLDQKRAEQKKKEALYNAIIDTAQAVITGFVKSGYVGAIFAAALGAAQLSIISSQEIPAYFEGGTHDGGKMLVNDAKGSSYKETIVLPNGNVLKPQSRNVLMDAPKGTQIYTPEQWHDIELNNMLDKNSINQSLSIVNSGLSKEDFNAGINKLYDKESFSLVRDSRGERIYKEKQGMKTELLNNRLQIKSFNV